VSDPTVLSYTLLDGQNVKVTNVAYVNYDGVLETVQALIGEWLAYGGLLDAVTQSQIIGGSIKIPTTADSSWKTSPVSKSSNAPGIVADYSASGSKKRFGVLFSNPHPGAISADGKVNLSDTALAAIIAALTAAFTNGNFANNVGQGLATFRDAFLDDRKHRKQLNRASEVTP
jgi:hypothetical protein